MAVSASYEERSRVTVGVTTSTSRSTARGSVATASGAAGRGKAGSILAASLRRARRPDRFEFTLFCGRFFDLCLAAISSVSTLVDRPTCASKLAARQYLTVDAGKNFVAAPEFY